MVLHVFFYFLFSKEILSRKKKAIFLETKTLYKYERYLRGYKNEFLIIRSKKNAIKKRNEC